MVNPQYEVIMMAQGSGCKIGGSQKDLSMIDQNDLAVHQPFAFYRAHNCRRGRIFFKLREAFGSYSTRPEHVFSDFLIKMERMSGSVTP